MPDTTQSIETTPSIRAQTKAHHAALILAAAAKVFAAKGFHAATLRDIATAAGFSTGAIFNNFSGKDELYTLIHGHPPITPEEGLDLRQHVALLLAERTELQDNLEELIMSGEVAA